MKIAIYQTDHEISQTVCSFIKDAIRDAKIYHANDGMQDADIHIAYGILRNCDRVFRQCTDAGKPWFNIDRGYFKSEHFSGFYRVSLNGTQQTTDLGELPINWKRWCKLGLEIMPPVQRDGYTLVCPPTEPVAALFGIDRKQWIEGHGPKRSLLREKGCQRSLDDDLAGASSVITFNSGVGWEALRRGIPVSSDPVHSIVGAWEKMLDGRATLMDTREHLFSVMAHNQITLEEMRKGFLWPRIEELLAAVAIERSNSIKNM